MRPIPSFASSLLALALLGLAACASETPTQAPSATAQENNAGHQNPALNDTVRAQITR